MRIPKATFLLPIILLLATLFVNVPIIYASPGATPTPPKIPSPPDVLGCATYTQATGWRAIPCISNPGKSTLLNPTEGGSATSNPIYGVSISASNANMGVVWLSFTTYSGEHDTLWGNNAYGVQTNTNYFTGNNGQTDWVQFVIQSSPNTINGYNPFERGCIWNIDVTTSSYVPTCVSMNIESLTSSYEGCE
jgi:hypothetical protein